MSNEEREIPVLMQSDFLGGHWRGRNWGYFGCCGALLGANLRLTKNNQLEFCCIVQNVSFQTASSFRCRLGGCAVWQESPDQYLRGLESIAER